MSAAFALGVALSPVGYLSTVAHADDEQSAASYAGTVEIGAPIQMQPFEQTLFDLLNADRWANGLPTLAFDPATLQIARTRAQSQLTDTSLTHLNPVGQLAFAQLLDQSQLSYTLGGENLARATSVDATVVQRVESTLMNSPTHRKNILEPVFDRVSVGVALGSDGSISFAQIYRAAP